MSQPAISLKARCSAEALGTFLLVFFGCGAVHVAVLGNLTGLWQVGIVWGIAIMLAIYVVGGISGAHINPAITTALATWGKFPRGEVLPYIGGQLTGAVLAAAVLFSFFSPFLAEKEKDKGVVRGQSGSEITAMCYGEYFPNPGRLHGIEGNISPGHLRQLNSLVSEPVAIAAEVLGTMILALVVFAITDERNLAAPAARLGPVFIGLTVAILICVIAPITQACFNPARDFGPRLVACIAGWGTVALPGPRPTGFLTVYILAPVIGAVAGGGLYMRLIRPCLPETPSQEPMS
jgi:glycerol uptake facilitator protein